MTGVGDQIELATLDLIFRGTPWPYGVANVLSLHVGDPGDTGANEVVGGTYARQTGVWAAPTGPSPTTIHLSAPVDFPGMPAVVVTFWGSWTPSGIFVFGGPTVTRTMVAGDVYRLGTGTTVSVE